MTLYHGGDVKRNNLGGVDFQNMQELLILLNFRSKLNRIE